MMKTMRIPVVKHKRDLLKNNFILNLCICWAGGVDLRFDKDIPTEQIPAS